MAYKPFYLSDDSFIMLINTLSLIPALLSLNLQPIIPKIIQA